MNDQIAESILPTAPIYPQEIIQIQNKELLDQLSKDRMKYMLSFIDTMKKDLTHYNKLSDKYLKLKHILTYSGISVGIGIDVIAITLELTFPIIFPISIGLIASASIAGPIFSLALNKIIDSKRNGFIKKSKNIEKYLNKLFIFIKEATEDKVISLQELQKFQLIFDEYNGKKKEIQNDVNNETEQQLKVLINEISKIRQNCRQIKSDQ